MLVNSFLTKIGAKSTTDKHNIIRDIAALGLALKKAVALNPQNPCIENIAEVDKAFGKITETIKELLALIPESTIKTEINKHLPFNKISISG